MSKASMPRRAALIAACTGATAVVGALGAVPASAATVPGQNIYGSGSSLQKIAQQKIWDPTWTSTPADHSTLSNDPTATYTSSSSGAGLAEFGNTTGALDLTQDPTADAVGQLDAYVGSDDPPTSANLTDASTAATGSAKTAIDEVTVPVAQAPVAVLLSLPTGITLGTGTTIKLSNGAPATTKLLQSIWDANVPASTDYPANTWGAVLEEAGLKKYTGTGTIPANDFKDAGGATGGDQGITLQVRSSSSGTSYTFKGFLNLSGDANYPTSYVTDADTWPVTTVNTGNTGGSQEVADTTASPGSVGYANTADAASGTPAYTSTPTTATTGGSHQILYALVQDNQGGTGTVEYANPVLSSHANVYTGANINENGAHPTYVGFWTVPSTATGTWGGTQASDPDVYVHAGKTTVYYPIVAATYDLGWTSYSEAGSNLVSDYGGTTADAQAAGNTASSLLTYEVASGKGQDNIAAGAAPDYYAKLPSKIDTTAETFVKSIKP